MRKVRYVQMSPFEVAVYDTKRNMIFIDERFKGTPEAERLIDHEAGHTRSSRPDVLYELKDSFFNSKEIIAAKPLILVNCLVPLTFYKDGKWYWSVDPLRLVIFISVVGLMALQL